MRAHSVGANGNGPVHEVKAGKIAGQHVLVCVGRTVNNYMPVNDYEPLGCAKCIAAENKKLALLWKDHKGNALYSNRLLKNDPEDETFTLQQNGITAIDNLTISLVNDISQTMSSDILKRHVFDPQDAAKKAASGE